MGHEKAGCEQRGLVLGFFWDQGEHGLRAPVLSSGKLIMSSRGRPKQGLRSVHTVQIREPRHRQVQGLGAGAPA